MPRTRARCLVNGSRRTPKRWRGFQQGYQSRSTEAPIRPNLRFDTKLTNVQHRVAFYSREVISRYSELVEYMCLDWWCRGGGESPLTREQISHTWILMRNGKRPQWQNAVGDTPGGREEGKRRKRERAKLVNDRHKHQLKKK